MSMQKTADNRGGPALLSLDANKAFDSVKWQYVWLTLEKFGFGERFISWMQLLYSAPVASNWEGSRTSVMFRQSRWTRQGCPLSPLFFAIAIEQLAAMIWMNENMNRCMRR